jgi:hypothetical protein
MQTDWIDLFQMHHIDRSCPWEEVWQAMETLVAQGKVVYVGSSNFAGWHIARASETARSRTTRRVKMFTTAGAVCRTTGAKVSAICSRFCGTADGTAGWAAATPPQKSMAHSAAWIVVRIITLIPSTRSWRKFGRTTWPASAAAAGLALSVLVVADGIALRKAIGARLRRAGVGTDVDGLATGPQALRAAVTHRGARIDGTG